MRRRWPICFDIWRGRVAEAMAELRFRPILRRMRRAFGHAANIGQCYAVSAQSIGQQAVRSNITKPRCSARGRVPAHRCWPSMMACAAILMLAARHSTANDSGERDLLNRIAENLADEIGLRSSIDDTSERQQCSRCRKISAQNDGVAAPR